MASEIDSELALSRLATKSSGSFERWRTTATDPYPLSAGRGILEASRQKPLTGLLEFLQPDFLDPYRRLVEVLVIAESDVRNTVLLKDFLPS